MRTVEQAVESPDARTAQWVAWIFVLGASLAAMTPLASIVNLTFPVLALGLAVWLLMNKSPEGFVVFALWLWVLAPEVRRIVDWSTIRHELSPVLMGPALVSAIALPWAVTRSGSVSRRSKQVFTVASIVFLYAGVVGLAQDRLLAVIGDVAQYVPPLILGFYILVYPRDEPTLRSSLLSFAQRALILIGVYGLIQFFTLPPWDAAWMTESSLTTIGPAIPMQFRVFSTLNAPGPMAGVVAALLMLIPASQSHVVSRSFAAVAGFVAIGLSQVRTAWFALVAGVLVLVRSQKFRSGRAAVVALCCAVLALILGGPIVEHIQDRVVETADEGVEDDSLTARLEFQSQIAGAVLTDPVGQGFGATGLASELQEGANEPFRSYDSGFFETLTTFGVIGGVIFLYFVIRELVLALRRSRHYGPTYVAFTAALMSLVATLVFGNPFTSVSGVLLWVSVAMLARPDAAGSRPVPGRVGAYG